MHKSYYTKHISSLIIAVYGRHTINTERYTSNSRYLQRQSRLICLHELERLFKIFCKRLCFIQYPSLNGFLRTFPNIFLIEIHPLKLISYFCPSFGRSSALSFLQESYFQPRRIFRPPRNIHLNTRTGI